jgi:hypothetical protein
LKLEENPVPADDARMVPSLSADLLGYLAWSAPVRAPLLAVEFTKVISDDDG